ncbi:hypothetical protein [Pseudomonas sp. 58 R 3]|nr:hypothetical protein [Pseudomonas sp. 58 R 3]
MRQSQGFHAHVDAVADFEVQRGQQPGLYPGFAWFGAASRRFCAEGLRGAFEFAAQRVLLVDRLDAGELDAIIGSDNAGELNNARVIQAQLRP